MHLNVTYVQPVAKHSLLFKLLVNQHAVSNAKCYLTIRYDTMRYDTIRYDTIRYDTIRYDTIRYDTIRYDTMQ